jgi:nicotinate phosphoribosyltransferase
VTGNDQSALGGVYKLSAIEDHQTRSADNPRSVSDPSLCTAIHWRPVMKLSEQPIKNSIPGKMQVRRYFRDDGTALADVIYNELAMPAEPWTAIDPADPTRPITHRGHTQFRDLLIPLMRQGQSCAGLPGLPDIQRHAARELATLHAGIRRFDHPHRYPVGLEQSLHELRQQLMIEGRAEVHNERRGQPR